MLEELIKRLRTLLGHAGAPFAASLPVFLGLTWFTLSISTGVVFAAQLNSLANFPTSTIGRGLQSGAAAFGFGLAMVTATTALLLMLVDRPRVRILGGFLAFLELLVSLFFAVSDVTTGFRAAMYVRIAWDGVLLWLATYERAPLRLPRLNRDLLVVVYAIAATVVGLGAVYGVGIFQFLINGLVVGSIYVLGAAGLSLIYGIRKFANFAHGETITFGAYMVLWINLGFQAEILYGVVFAVAMTAALSMVLEFVVFRQLAGRGPVSLLVASIGVTIFLNNLISASFGTSIQSYDVRVAVSWILLDIDGVPVLTLNPVKGVATLVACVLLILFLHLLLSRTTLGKAMRATADNPDLARASGINTRNVILWTWAIAGAMAAVAGAMLGIVNDVRPGMGFNVLLFVFAAVIVGGLGSPYGAMLGGFLVGIAQELSVALLFWLGRPEVLGLEQAVAYKPVAAFLIMILVLLLKPEGLVSSKRAAGSRPWVRWFRQLGRGDGA